jgi:PHD/YefM family antitoxin component YafN of YafNO toxin-antitoxin module
MLHTISIAEAKKHLAELPTRLASTHGAIVVTEGKKPVMVVMPWVVYESIVKTLEQWSDKDLIERLRAGICEVTEAPARKKPARAKKAARRG